MWKLINLRHLVIRRVAQLSYIPQGIGRLTCLRTLSDFIVGGASEGCKIGELKNLNLLQGDLNIQGLGGVETVNEAVEMKMKQKQLHTLMLGFEGFDSDEEMEMENLLSKRMEDVLEVLEPHPDVVELSVHDYLGFKLSSWIGSTSILSHLKALNLHCCINLTKFPAFGKLPSLEVLEISRAIKVKHIGSEFYSDSLEHVKRPTFPKLKRLSMNGMDNLEVWDLEHGEVMPKVESISLENCPKLKALPALGKLPSLEVLDIRRAIKVKHIGFEFYSDSLEHVKRPTFPKLKLLSMDYMHNLEVWDLEHGDVMPKVESISLENCPKLKALPALGKLPSLEYLRIIGADELRHVGREFLYEVDEAGGEHFRNIAFPKLETLYLTSKGLELGIVGSTGGGEENIIIMPRLRYLKIGGFKNSKPFVEILSKISSLEILEISGEATDFIKYIRDDDDDRETIFPNLKTLILVDMEDMEELKIGFQVMPLLKRLEIHRCNKLKSIQGSLLKLETLKLEGFASLYELRFPNLKSLYISQGPIHPSLPEAFATTLQGLEDLCIFHADKSWTCIPEQVQQLTSLKSLRLYRCGDELEQRCRKDEGEDWRIISHIPNIQINRKDVRS